MIDENGDDISEEQWLNKIHKNIRQIQIDRYADEFRAAYEGKKAAIGGGEHGDSN